MEMSPPPCPPTMTIRRNPFRKARATPYSAIPLREPLSSSSIPLGLPHFPLQDILSVESPRNPSCLATNSEPQARPLSVNLKVYLRIRPIDIKKNGANSKRIRNVTEAEQRNAWPKTSKTKINSKEKLKRSSQVCVTVNEDLHSVTVSPPQVAQGAKRIKSVVYEGFSYVFSSEASQSEVYSGMLRPLVQEFLEGKSGLLAAMGPTGSGKTHTVFGCTREPGMVPLALRHMFSLKDRETKQSRTFYLSLFEICSEKGKAERMIDLSQRGGDICMQQSVLKGLQEEVVHDCQQAESLIALGMLKRATAMTNSNTQSSRSQCIINIRCVPNKVDGEKDDQSSSVLTIVDFAGAEREKKTGNQGTRLLESNFINNTSMVFGLCLRSLLEHQKNPKKPLQKHFQNSLLTRYLRDYLEGKKRMTLILTVKPGEDDYLDTSFLLRQASPFTKIKFKNIEEPQNLNFNKRPVQALPREEQLKRMRFTGAEASLTVEENVDRGMRLTTGGILSKEIDIGKKNYTKTENCKVEKVAVCCKEFAESETNPKASLNGNCLKSADSDRKYQIMQEFSKALWKVLKQYKEKLEIAEKEICHLRDSLTSEKTRSLDLDNELKELKAQCTCSKDVSAGVSVQEIYDAEVKLPPCQPTASQEGYSGVSFHYLKEFEQTENARGDICSSSDCISIVPRLSTHECESDNSHGDCKYPNILETEQAQPENSTADKRLFSLDGDQKALGVALSDCTISSSESSQEDDSCSLAVEENNHIEDGKGIGNAENEKDFEDTGKENMHSDSETIDELTTACFSGGHGCEVATQGNIVLEDANTSAENERGDVCPNCEIVPIEARLSAPEECENACSTSGVEDHGCEAATEITSVVEYAKTSADIALADICSNSECLSVEPCLSIPQKCESANSTSVVEEHLGQLAPESTGIVDDDGPEISTREINTRGNRCYSSDEDQTAFCAAASESTFSSLESVKKHNSILVEEEIFQNEDCKINSPISSLPKERRKGRNVPKVKPKTALCCNTLNAEKPKRRLLPASSVLLKDINYLDVDDEDEKPKGGRREKNEVVREQTRTQGSISLINLLRSNLRR